MKTSRNILLAGGLWLVIVLLLVSTVPAQLCVCTNGQHKFYSINLFSNSPDVGTGGAFQRPPSWAEPPTGPPPLTARTGPELPVMREQVTDASPEKEGSGLCGPPAPDTDPLCGEMAPAKPMARS